jgi:hypothetical protein
VKDIREFFRQLRIPRPKATKSKPRQRVVAEKNEERNHHHGADQQNGMKEIRTSVALNGPFIMLEAR